MSGNCRKVNNPREGCVTQWLEPGSGHPQILMSNPTIATCWLHGQFTLSLPILIFKMGILVCKALVKIKRECLAPHLYILL